MYKLFFKRIILFVLFSVAFMGFAYANYGYVSSFPTTTNIPFYHDGTRWHEINIVSTDGDDKVTYYDYDADKGTCKSTYYGQGHYESRKDCLNHCAIHYTYSDNRGNKFSFDFAATSSLNGDKEFRMRKVQAFVENVLRKSKEQSQSQS